VCVHVYIYIYIYICTQIYNQAQCLLYFYSIVSNLIIRNLFIDAVSDTEAMSCNTIRNRQIHSSLRPNRIRKTIKALMFTAHFATGIRSDYLRNTSLSVEGTWYWCVVKWKVRPSPYFCWHLVVLHRVRAGLDTYWRSGRQIIWHPLKPIFFKDFFVLCQGWRTCLWVDAEISNNFRGDFLACKSWVY
jgi:hypothetical protein